MHYTPKLIQYSTSLSSLLKRALVCTHFRISFSIPFFFSFFSFIRALQFEWKLRDIARDLKGLLLAQFAELNRGKVEADKEGKKEKMRRRKEKRKRKENVEVKQKRKNLQDKGHKIDGEKKVQETTDSTIRKDNLTEEVKQPKKFEGKHDSSGSFCACWVCFLHADFDLLLPCLFQLKKCLDQVLYRNSVCSTATRTDTAVHEKFKKTSTADEKVEAVLVPSFSQNGSLQIESQFKELVLNWVPPPLETLSSEFNDQDQQWLYDSVSLRNDTDKKINAINDHLCYPLTMLF